MDGDLAHLRHAMRLAHETQRVGNLPIGAVITLDEQVVAEGRNAIWAPQLNPHRHAEIEALEALPSELRTRAPEMTLYTTLEPCLMCLGAILVHRIGRVVFGSSDSRGGATGVFGHMPPAFEQLLRAVEWVGPALPQECDELDETVAALLTQHKIGLKQKTYRPASWIDPRIEVRPSQIHGQGMFATAPIKKGEIVNIWGGTRLLTEADIEGKKAQEWRAKGYDWATIGEGLFLAGRGTDLTDFINHACDPNVWLADEVTLTAKRDIPSGEELTIDYVLFEGDEDWTPTWRCRCGSECCRGVFTGRDWRRQDLQERYSDHFSPFINERIQKRSRKCERIRYVRLCGHTLLTGRSHYGSHLDTAGNTNTMALTKAQSPRQEGMLDAGKNITS